MPGAAMLIGWPLIDLTLSLAFDGVSVVGLSLIVFRGLSERTERFARLDTKLFPARLMDGCPASDCPA